MKQTKTSGRIVVVDNRTVRRDAVIGSLSADGHTCIEAASVEEASELLAPYDLVLLDIDLARRTQGRALFERLHQDESLSSVQVVIMTDYDASPGSIAACIAAGAADYVTRPFAVKQLTLSPPEHEVSASGVCLAANDRRRLS